ncbi:hypothetical protein GGS23DRAFT_598449 [Durotheca rogersii]|uniref:uncharacterized protein n=1 Tax=Durotheca rogersii TaxID=419775 RepID=UPI002220C6F6|nr:uncharacterized protein GGS23DRAFT_598449 [Durotheca rogersii]KAI5861675.1 hypothetical protein GGS23DRAFT_598449 [Durotheca rogersii]
MSRKRQSLLRLEALGGLSDCYSEVATIRPDGIDNDSDAGWETSSNISTEVVVFDKPPPPGSHLRSIGSTVGDAAKTTTVRRSDTAISDPVPTSPSTSQRSRTVSSDPTGDSSRCHYAPTGEPVATRLRRTRAQQRPVHDSADSQERRRLGKRLSQLQRQAAARYPESRTSSVKRTSSGYSTSHEGDCKSSTNPRPLSGSSDNWRPQKPIYAQRSPSGHESQPGCSGSPSPQPVSSRFSAYMPRDEQQSSPSSRPGSLNLPGVSGQDYDNNDWEDEDLHSERTGSSSSLDTRASSGRSSAIPSVPQSVTIHIPLYRAVHLVATHTGSPDGRSFLTPLSSPISAPFTFSFSLSGSSSLSDSVALPVPVRNQCSNSPSRGSWVSDRPRQTRPPLIERVRERLEQGVHLRLQKAGRRPLSSFHVRRVVKCEAATPLVPPGPGAVGLVGDLAEVEADMGMPFAMRWRNEMLRREREEQEEREREIQRRQAEEDERRMRERDEETARRESGSRLRREKRKPLPLKVPLRDDSLFLGDAVATRTPATDSFFAPAWSQDSARRSQPTLPPLPPSGAIRSPPASSARPEAPTQPPSPHPRDSADSFDPGDDDDDRNDLPSRRSSRSGSWGEGEGEGTRRGGADPRAMLADELTESPESLMQRRSGLSQKSEKLNWL